MSSELRSQAALFVRATRVSFAYKPAVLVSMVTAGVGYAVPMLVWRHIYSVRGDALAVPARTLFPYLLLAGVLNFALTLGVEGRVGHRIRLGLVATDLLRPVDFQLTQLTQTISDVVFNVALVLPVVLLAYYGWGHEAVPAGGVQLGWFGLSAALALVIQFALSFIFVQTAFVTYSSYGTFVARSALHQAFSGLSAPLALFPPALRSVAECLPFRHVIHTPVSICLGELRGEMLAGALLQQLAWALGLLLLGRVLLRGALARFEIQGG